MNGMQQTENTNLLQYKVQRQIILAFGENEIELELFINGMKLTAENMQYLKGD